MKQENITETNANGSFLGILPNLSFVTATKERKTLKSLFGIHQGVQVMSKPHSLRLVGLVLLGLLTSHLVGTSLIHSAYAASYVNVSSGGGNSGTSAEETVSPGIVNLGSIKPSSTGTMATGNDTLTIHTDCSAGYKVYVSGQNGKSTNLINSNAEDPTSPEATELISSASNLPTATTSASSLNNNTWGINGNATDISSHLYYGLPSYSDSTAYPLVTKSEVPEESTVPIYYGVKVNTDITPGTYTGDVLYTVIMNTSCTTYNVSFNANGGTGTMNNQAILVGETNALNENAFTRSGYGFLGWSTSAKGKTGTATNGIGTPNDVDYTNESEVTDLINAGQTITLYAIWIKVDGNMQSWNGCSGLATNGLVRLIDTRDNNVYAIKKLADGKCWMVQNLRLINKELTSSDSSVSSNFTVPASTDPTKTAWCNTNDSACDDQSLAYYDANTRYSYGALYNWYTATAGTGTYSTSSGIVSSSICPKGWKLPIGGTGGEFENLDRAWGGTGSGRNNANTYPTFTGDYASGANGGFDLPGNISDSLLGYVESSGDWWSAKAYSSTTANALHLDASYANVSPRYGYGKNSGRSVRCIVDNYTIQFDANGGTGTMDNQVVFGNSATTQTIKSSTFTKTGYHFLGWSTDSSATTATYTDGQTLTTALAENGRTIKLYAVWKANYMQDFDCASMTPNTTITLIDSRDNQAYTVYRWPASATASSSYPTNMSGYCLMTKDLSLGYVTGGSVTKGSNLTLTAANSQSAGTITARTGTGSWSTTNSDSNTQYINGTGGTYDSHSYYSWPAAQKVCPKGWRVATRDEHANIQAFMGGNTEAASMKIRNAPYNYILGGGIYSTSGFSFMGSYGNYWTSTEASTTNGISFDIGKGGTTGVYFSSDGGKSQGRSVRCISEPHMQNWAGCPNLSINDTMQLTDTRDNNKYWVKKLKDGKCWMVENLRLVGSKTLTSSDSNVSSSFTLAAPTTGSSTWCDDNNSACYDKSLVYNYTDSSSYGALYNWYSATAGTGKYSTTSGKVSSDICPKGWSLPTSGSDGEFVALDKALGGTGINRDNANTYSVLTGSYTSGNNAGFVLSGFYYGWGSGRDSSGAQGEYWASTVGSNNSAGGFSLLSSSSRVSPAGGNLKRFGFAVRCIARL